QRFKVMHPVWCLESRAQNTHLEQYRTPHALRRLSAAVKVSREFLGGLLDEPEGRSRMIRSTLKLNERVDGEDEAGGGPGIAEEGGHWGQGARKGSRMRPGESSYSSVMVPVIALG